MSEVRSASRGAVFLSYASQDAVAARRLCESLRTAGVDVWFDVEGGLETGDEWDAKIRRQIKECVLFLPLISSATQSREEGYFRIEWELAAQRALVPDDLRTAYWWRRGPEPYAGLHCAGPWPSQGPAQFPVTPTHFVVTLPANRSVVARSTACLRPTVGVL